MKRVILLLLAFVILLSGCANSQGGSIMWRTVSQEEAMKIMEEEADYVILDVRTQAEYDEGHIPGAVLVPHDTIKGDVPELPDKKQLILVYCRSGNRSKQAAQALADAGYESVVEFGGINTWPGEIVTD
ncbi:MAG: rhodanese-like domain-containing protein [Oscillospiraceae bacterium]|nr:rhodanese-like domain-containing protein [Oscillospiraceae bacterium]